MDQTKAIFKDLFKNIIQEYNEPFINQLKLQENQIKIQENQLKIQENQLKIQETEINTLKELLKKPNIEKKYILLPWILQNISLINWFILLKNHNTIHIIECLISNNILIDWDSLSSNPNAIYLLEQNQDKINWHSLSSNPNAIHLLEQNQDKINWDSLSSNPNAIHLLEQNQDKINWMILSRNSLSSNPNAIHLLEQNKDKICWYSLSSNPNAIHLLEQNQDKINWYSLSSNPNAIHLLEQNQDKIYWKSLSNNPNAIHLLEQNKYKICWFSLSSNLNAIHLLEQNQDKINWMFLSSNPNSIHLLEQNKNKINWDSLSRNPNAIHLLEQNQDKINWNCLSRNPKIYEISEINNIEYNKIIIETAKKNIELLDNFNSCVKEILTICFENFGLVKKYRTFCKLISSNNLYVTLKNDYYKGLYVLKNELITSMSSTLTVTDNNHISNYGDYLCICGLFHGNSCIDAKLKFHTINSLEIVLINFKKFNIFAELLCNHFYSYVSHSEGPTRPNVSIIQFYKYFAKNTILYDNFTGDQLFDYFQYANKYIWSQTVQNQPILPPDYNNLIWSSALKNYSVLHAEKIFSNLAPCIQWLKKDIIDNFKLMKNK